MTKTSNCTTFEDWAISPDAGLEPPFELSRHLQECQSCEEFQSTMNRDLASLDALMRSDEPPAIWQAETLNSLQTPGWQLRQLRSWRLPAAALASLVAASTALLHPLPTGLSETSGTLAMLSTPLATIGEIARLLASGSRGLSVAPAEPVTGLLCFVALVGLTIGLRKWLVETGAPVSTS